MSDYTVEILLSTYNGELYLQEQLDSLLNQTYSSIRVIIRDDGSSDSTESIIESYISRYPHVISRSDAPKGNLGPAQSFMSMLEFASAPYLMFCDQDDIWNKDKVEQSLKALQRLESVYPNEPAMIFTDLSVVDESCMVLNESFWAYQSLNPAISKEWEKLLALNVVTGCTMIFNQQALKASLPFSIPEMLHDQWVAVSVAKYGRVEYLNEQTILYRQHMSNVEGAHQFSLRYILNKCNNLFGILCLLRKQCSYFEEPRFLKLCFYKFRLNMLRLLK